MNAPPNTNPVRSIPRLSEATIRDAFNAHWNVYVMRKGWSIAHRCDCYRLAHRAFDPARPDPEAFRQLYREIGWGWQAFRPGYKPNWSHAETFGRMLAFPADARNMALTALDSARVERLRPVVNGLAGLKRTGSGPSLVAMSKFLHFWNPSLFVIVDSIIRQCLERLHLVPVPGAFDPNSYTQFLDWCGRLMRDNPAIQRCFVAYYRERAGSETAGLPVECFEAAAAECLLLGLAELPTNALVSPCPPRGAPA